MKVNSTFVATLGAVTALSLTAMAGAETKSYDGDGSTAAWIDGSFGGFVGLNVYTLEVADSGTIESLKSVSLDIFHTWAGDISITLEHNGTTVTLLDRPGFPQTANGIADDFTNGGGGAGLYAFVESGGLTFPEVGGNGSLAEGAYNSQDTLQDFVGMDKQGTWTLTVGDGQGGDIGFVDGWHLTLNNVPAPGALALLGLAGLAGNRRRR